MKLASTRGFEQLIDERICLVVRVERMDRHPAMVGQLNDYRTPGVAALGENVHRPHSAGD